MGKAEEWEKKYKRELNPMEKALAAQLDMGEAYRSQTIAELSEKAEKLDAEIAMARRGVEVVRAEISRWQSMSPYLLIGELKEAREREALGLERAKEEEYRAKQRQRIELGHKAALRACKSQSKGIIAPASTKGVSFAFCGGALGIFITPLIAMHYLGVEGELARHFVVVLGGILGALAGFYVYDLNFVVDESIEDGPFR